MTRTAKRRASRARQQARRDLVHAAGCTEPRCTAKSFADIAREVAEDLHGRPISVPRSLRPVLGLRLVLGNYATGAEFRRAFGAVLQTEASAFQALADHDAGRSEHQ